MIGRYRRLEPIYRHVDDAVGGQYDPTKTRAVPLVKRITERPGANRRDGNGGLDLRSITQHALQASTAGLRHRQRAVSVSLRNARIVGIGWRQHKRVLARD